MQGLKNLSTGAIELKSIKSADINFNPILFSYILPWSKFFIKSNEDLIYVDYMAKEMNSMYFAEPCGSLALIR